VVGSGVPVPPPSGDDEDEQEINRVIKTNPKMMCFFIAKKYEC
jgi:hypothetical protein